VSLYNF